MNTKIKDWYVATYPTDELGQKLTENKTFYDLFEALDFHQDVYKLFGVDDSLIRERLFEKLAELMECDYEYIYNQWLS